jgi:hypothetical protein
VEIATPIKQIVYGKGGVYRCILMEQRGVTAERFKEMSESAGHRAPESKRDKGTEDSLLERSFWSRWGGQGEGGRGVEGGEGWGWG